MAERVTFARSVTIEKVDAVQHIAWGYAYVVEDGGDQVVDHSGQIISAAEVQKAAHGFVLESRTGGVMHAKRAGDIVDSIFFTPELNALLEKRDGKVGWFLGMHVQDPEVWKRVESGELRMFSIGGSGHVKELDDAA